MTPVGPRQRTFAQWSLEHTVDTGLRANQKQVQALREHVTSAFQAGIEHLADSQMQSAKLLQRELQYQADNIVDAIDRGSSDIATAIQKACDYLGGELCEVRWVIERQTLVSQQILQVLLNSLDNTSRQYYEQGVKWYEDSEYELAQERFQLALKENSRNYFAYQYLGFISVNREKSQEALRNFELARKSAENDYHKALALSHLARSYNAVGELPKALQCSTAATQAAPGHAKFWYERAIYHVRSGNAAEAVKCLRRAIGTDWVYWSISITDSSLEPIRRGVQELLEAMREEQRTVARNRLDQFKQALTTLSGMQISGEVAEQAKTLNQCEAQYRDGTVFAYRALVPTAQQAQKKALQAAVAVLDQRIATNRSLLAQCRSREQQAISAAQARISQVNSQANSKAGSYSSSGLNSCLIGVGLLAGAFSLLVYIINSNAGPDYAKTASVSGTVVLICMGLVVLGWLLPHIMKLLTAELPAEYIRGRIPALERELERVRIEAGATLELEATQLDKDLQQLQGDKATCQGMLEGTQTAESAR
jgi:tetratricopeptide (TPR) repeat protein